MPVPLNLPLPTIVQLDTLTRRIASGKSSLLKDIEQLVRIESPSDSPSAVDAAIRFVERRCIAIGGRTRRHIAKPSSQKQFGDVLEVHFPASKRGRSAPAEATRPVLLLGHLDTVWALGTLERMPCRVADGRMYGPGVYDMKAGVIMALTAVGALVETGLLTRPVSLLLVSDEEIGSPFSRPITEKLARKSSAVYVLEPAQGPHGACKTSRKGVGEYRLAVNGVGSHSGVDFDAGHSAVLELSRQIVRLASFTELDRGLTVNPGVIGGGTRSNVIASEAWVDIDVRVRTNADATRIEKNLRSLEPFDEACALTLTGGLNRPPMERTRGTGHLYKCAAAIAARLGFELQEAATGGGSDGNFTSALGLPTLDGMGAVGHGAHASDESILIDALVPRTVLLAAMLL